MKNTLKTLIISFYLFSVILPVLTPPTVNAQEAQGIIVIPPALSKDVKAGNKLVQEFSVSNMYEFSNEYKIVTKQIQLDNQGKATIPDEYKSDPRAMLEKEGWLTIEPSQFTLAPKAKQKFTVTIDIPSNIPTQAYYLEIFVQITNPQDTDKNVALQTEVSIPVAINLISDQKQIKKIELLSFLLTDENRIEPGSTKALVSSIFTGADKDNDKIFHSLPINLETIIKNIGNTHVLPSGQIFISHDPDFKNIDKKITFNTQQNSVFTNGSRLYKNSIDAGVVDEHDTQFSPTIGKYYVQLNAVWQNEFGTEYITETICFYYIPIDLVLIIIGVVIVLGIGIFALTRKKSKKK